MFARIIKGVFQIILEIIVGVIIGVILNAIGQAKSPANVYEEPKVTAPIIYHIEQHQTVIIVDDSPRYYYVVEAKGEDDEHVKRGYVSKRSIRITEETAGEDSTATDQP